MFAKLKERLQREGWYVGWALPCCQTCAWQEVPYEHEEGPFTGGLVNIHKVLFSHEQDCQLDVEYDNETDEYILPDGYTEGDYCTIPHYRPNETDGSLFCFAGDDEGVKNLIEVLPLIEESGCKIIWNQTGNMRPYISWENEQKTT